MLRLVWIPGYSFEWAVFKLWQHATRDQDAAWRVANRIAASKLGAHAVLTGIWVKSGNPLYYV